MSTEYFILVDAKIGFAFDKIVRMFADQQKQRCGIMADSAVKK